MENINVDFNTIVETIYNLPLDERLELKTLLEHNIAEARRDEIFVNFKKAKGEEKTGKLTFSSNVEALKKLL